MSYAEEIRKRLLSEEKTMPLRGVIYARVSTDKDSQKESCANQVYDAERYIQRHPNVVLVGTFVDDGISGKNDYNRPQYNAMLRMIEEGRVDLVITKALSRLNRDQLNSLLLTSTLVDNNATVLTLEDNQVHDFEDINSDLIHCINYAIDEQYVKRQSMNARKTQALRCDKKQLSAKDISFGYFWDRNKKDIIIDEEKAEIVREVFEDYVYRSSSPAEIYKELKKRGLDVCERTVTNILLNERYIGRFYINKKTSKLGTGKKKSQIIKLPPEEWILVERPDLVIVDKELFEMAKRVRETRKNIYHRPDKATMQAYFTGTHKYSAKLYCSACGKPFHYDYADRDKTIPVYRIRKHSECESRVKKVYEENLDQVVSETLKRVFEQQKNVFPSLADTLTKCLKSDEYASRIEKLKKDKALKIKRIDTLIDALADEGLTDVAKKRIIDNLNSMEEEVQEISTKIDNYYSYIQDDELIKKRIEGLRASIKELKKFNKIDRERIKIYIEHISVSPNGDFDVYLRAGKSWLLGGDGAMRNPQNAARDVSVLCNQGAPNSEPSAYLRFLIP
ncbi:MAG: recombinase family protein [Saccharofermentans sp.]|nr:recombinase family protein [Saccharofermentans sp.]